MRGRGKTLAAPDWAEGLPRELLALILDHLTAGDHVRFTAVCAFWRSAAREAQRRPAPQAPWVLLRPPAGRDEKKEDEDEGTYDSFFFLRPHDGKLHSIRRPIPSDFFRKRVVGISPEGWVLVANKRRELRALNPVTGARQRLPRLATIPKGYSKKCIKAVMSSLYAPRPCFTVFMALLDNGRQKRAVWLAREGDRRWSLVGTEAMAEIYDLAYHRGEFYILGKKLVGNADEEVVCVAVVGCGGCDSSLQPGILEIGPKCPMKFGHRLVVSTSGDLLLAFSHGNTNRLVVCRLDFIPDGNGGRAVRPVQLEGLGDHALLLAPECSMFVSTLQVPELRRDCVYEVDLFFQWVVNFIDGKTQFRRSDMRIIGAGWFMPGVL